MKIIVEEGDFWPGPPGTYEFHQTRTDAKYATDPGPGGLRHRSLHGPISVELHGRMGRQLCRLCGEATCAKECPERIAKDLVKQLTDNPPEGWSVNRCDNLDGPCSCGAWHTPDSPMTGRRFDRMIIDDVTGETPAGRRADEKRRQFMAAYGIKAEKLAKQDAPFRRGDIAKATGPCTIGNGKPEAFVPQKCKNCGQPDGKHVMLCIARPPIVTSPGQCVDCQERSEKIGKETPRCWNCPDSVAKRAAMPEPIYFGAPCQYILKYPDDDPRSSDAPMTDAQREAAMKWFTEKMPTTVKADVVYVDGNFKVPNGMVDRAIREVMERNKDAIRKALDLPMDKGEARKDWSRYGCEQCGNTHGDACTCRKTAQAIQAGAHELEVAAIMKCAECLGTGEWENPANGKRSPCSRGCKP